LLLASKTAVSELELELIQPQMAQKPMLPQLLLLASKTAVSVRAMTPHGIYCARKSGLGITGF
jgi:hypothetical protein